MMLLSLFSLPSILLFLSLILAGIKVKVEGNPGHGSRFIEDTAAEKLVRVHPIKTRGRVGRGAIYVRPQEILGFLDQL